MGHFRPSCQLKIKVPTSVEIEYLEDKVRFKGSKASISDFAEDLRKISKLEDGQLCKLDKLIQKVSDYITADQDKVNWIELPDHLPFLKAGLTDTFTIICISDKDLETAKHYYKGMEFEVDLGTL